MAPATDRIVIGVDFGTTFSGVAEAYSGTPVAANEINVIKTWPGGNNVTSDKVPSQIAYDQTTNASEEVDWTLLIPEDFRTVALQDALADTGSASEDATTIRWGFQLSSDEPRLRCMKLFLDQRQKLPSFVSNSVIQQLFDDCGKDATSVVADYLTMLYKHTMEELTRRYGDLFVSTTDIQWVLTVPAIWSDAAKDKTLTAARKSGMGPELTLISEPEAAAVYTLQAIQPNHLQVGDNFVVCDAGGGTVDLISYEIRQTHPLRIEESAEGSGACCGAAMLNAEFEGLIRQKMGDSAFFKLRYEKPKSMLVALKYFEDYVKRNYDPTKPTNFNVPFPGVTDNKDAGIEQGFLNLSYSEVSRMFQPTVSEILRLVDGQIRKLREKNKTVAGIVLVGGFGQSGCLYKALKGIYTSKLETQQLDKRFEVLQPLNAWTAVVRGAVLRGVEGVEMVLSRKSRRHYGVECSQLFNSAVHPKSLKVWSKHEGVWKAENQIKWYIEKGQTVSSAEPILFNFYRIFSRGASKTVIAELLFCDADNAPRYFKRTDDLSSKTLCSMIINLSNVPAHHFKTHQAVDGSSYQRLSYELGMQIESGGLKFDLRVDGISYGSVVASFDAD